MKRLGTFKRTTQEEVKHDWKYILIILAIYWGYNFFIVLGQLTRGNMLKQLLIESMFKSLIVWAILFVLIYYSMPPDFTYTIVDNVKYIIFRFPDGSEKLISKSFEIKKRWRYLELRDKEVKFTITIPYNKEVLKVLKEVQN